MPLTFRVLGGFGSDNALFVTVDTGQRISRLLFDCGDGCPHALDPGELLAVDHLFFSHFHMDHVSGFDLFFRLNFDRADRPVNVWVPPGGADILHHRFRGFAWNLVGSTHPGTWHVHEVSREAVRTTAFHAREAFRTGHPLAETPRAGSLLASGDGYTVEVHLMNHGTVSLGYVVREASRVNVDAAKMAALGLAPGPWVKRVRGRAAEPGETVAVGGVAWDLARLQSELLATTPGGSVAYLTDYRPDAAARDYLAEHLRGVNTVVSESQYRPADRKLAEDTSHACADEVAEVAARAGVGRLVLMHVSPRYLPDGVGGLLAEARAVFPNTSFPEGWSV